MILRRKISQSVLILFGVVLVSCEKEELPVTPHIPGDEQTNQIAMEEDYRNQLFFDIGSNEIVSSNLKVDWDIAFESKGNRVILNSAKGMAAHQSTEVFGAITSESGADWQWDAHSGNLDSTAIGDWMAGDFTYMIDRGYSHEGVHQGYSKLKIIAVDENQFQIQYGDISETAPLDEIISKSTETAFVYFSFDEGVVSIAPPDGTYDLLFTQYTHIFTNPITPYLVTGVLLNRTDTRAMKVEETDFSEITFETIDTSLLSNEINAIGYDWKGYDLEAGLFTTYPEMNYVIETAEGFYYKLHFTNFYNDQGIKGFPTIEFQEL